MLPVGKWLPRQFTMKMLVCYRFYLYLVFVYLVCLHDSGAGWGKSHDKCIINDRMRYGSKNQDQDRHY